MTKTEFTIFGATGFIGSRLVKRLGQMGHAVRPASRASMPQAGQPLGHAIYTIGMTADFRSKPFETVEAHVSLLSRILSGRAFDSFLFLSSTRVYRGAATTAEEEPLRMSPVSPDRLYDLSKLCGEALCLALPSPAIRVARLSNVFGGGHHGSQNFLTSVFRDAIEQGSVTLRQGIRSEKDYVHVGDVCDALTHIAVKGGERIYNVAAGVNTSHGAIAEVLSRATAASIDVAAGASDVVDAPIDVRRLASEMDWQPRSLTEHLPGEIEALLAKRDGAPRVDLKAPTRSASASQGPGP